MKFISIPVVSSLATMMMMMPNNTTANVGALRVSRSREPITIAIGPSTVPELSQIEKAIDATAKTILGQEPQPYSTFVSNNGVVDCRLYTGTSSGRPLPKNGLCYETLIHISSNDANFVQQAPSRIEALVASGTFQTVLNNSMAAAAGSQHQDVIVASPNNH